jgi:AraC-like DNA-binding protein
MTFTEYPPSAALTPYIDAYWIIETDAIIRPGARRFFVDGYLDLFINMGTSVPLVNNTLTLAPGKMYLNSALRTCLDIEHAAGSYFVGVRFKPGGYPALYRADIGEIADRIFYFDDPRLQLLLDVDAALFDRLDRYFLSRIKEGQYPALSITETIKMQKGKISVDALARHHNITTRTMERLFHSTVGVSPKEFIGIIRFQQVLERLRFSTSESLLSLAVESGYYDHAHMTREVKKIAGVTPSQLMQSFQASGSIFSTVVR